MRIMKKVAFSLAWLLAAPLIVLSWLERRLLPTSGIFHTGAQLVAILPGPVGTYIRSAYYSGTLEACHWEVHIGFGTLFMHRKASVARNVSTGAWCVLGHARLGAGVRLASRVSIPSGRRQHFDDHGRLSAVSRFDDITIGEGCWVGEGAIVMADIGSGSVVSAGAVVTKPMPGGYLIVGNPAQEIRVIHTAKDGAS